MRILLFEDARAEDLTPIALVRPVFELVCGRDSLRRRLQRWFPEADFGVWVRPWLVDAYAEEQPTITVNNLNWIRSGKVLVVNGRWLPERRLTDLDFVTHQTGFVDGHPAWMLIPGEELGELMQGDPATALGQYANSQRGLPTSGCWIQYPWDLVSQNAAQLIRDFTDEGVSDFPKLEHVQVLGDPTDVYISRRAEIDPYVVIDARSGPVSIDRDAKIQSFTRIEGPCHIGRGSQLFRALVRKGTTIGEHCRVGGEIEASVMHSYVNKYHEGFVGHSYICPWVNIGAMSCTSDLKNDYTTVKVPLRGQMIDSGLSKVGSFIGDHAKTAMDSMFNSGSSIGICTMVIPGGRLLPRNIPSFSSVMFGQLSDNWTLDAAIETARSMMNRRNQTLTITAERLLRIVHQRTEQERQNVLQYAMNHKVFHE
ncbi:MAG: putative sugar nucleotidyl transferase [Planctomycetales bacterium]|nr:putative sugar nucleotidyl transferase [Planctomycetales bacterium]